MVDGASRSLVSKSEVFFSLCHLSVVVLWGHSESTVQSIIIVSDSLDVFVAGPESQDEHRGGAARSIRKHEDSLVGHIESRIANQAHKAKVQGACVNVAKLLRQG